MAREGEGFNTLLGCDDGRQIYGNEGNREVAMATQKADCLRYCLEVSGKEGKPNWVFCFDWLPW